MLLSTATILVSVFLLITLNITFIEKVNNDLSVIDDIRAGKIENILKMQVIVRERSMVMLAMFLEKDLWIQDEQYMHFTRLAGNFISLRDSFLSSQITDSEKDEFKAILALIRKTEPLQMDIVERIKSGNLENVGDDITRRDMHMERELLARFDGLLGTISQNAILAKNLANENYLASLRLITLISMLVIMVIIILMFRSLKGVQGIELALMKKAESLGWDATHDHMTKVHNRRWLAYKIDFLESNAASRGAMHAILYMDLDDFKPINDSYGHMVGDIYLERFCRNIEHCIRQNDTFARIGGDEFAVLLEHCDESAARKIAENILTVIKHFSISHEGNKISAGCSIGVLLFKPGGIEFESIIRKADELCYRAKSMGKNQIVCEVSNQ